MSAATPQRLYRNLPAFLRVRDDREGEPLRTLLRVVETELQRIEGDIAGLYDNWFIETCAEWVVPYIGDLLAVRGIRSVESAGVSLRAYVANTLDYRRRKGTAAVLEQLARDTTGWPSHAVEFFARLATTQQVNHVRLTPPATAAIRDAAAAELVGTAFDRLGHTADVRRIATGRGRHNIPNIGIFLWRLQSYPIGRGESGGRLVDYGTARKMSDDSGRTYFTFHPAGLDAPLYHEPQTEETITHLSQEENVPGRLRRLALNEELERIRRAERTGESAEPLPFLSPAAPDFRVLIDGGPVGDPIEVRREDIYLCDIPDEVELASPVPNVVAVDPERGRLRFPAALDPERVFVTFSYGFSGDLGGGPYDRTASIERADSTEKSLAADTSRNFLSPRVWQAGVSHLGDTAGAPGMVFASLRQAVAAWNGEPPGRIGVIAIMDSMSEEDPGGFADPIEVIVPERSRLLIAAADWPLEEDPVDPTTIRRRPGRLRGAGVRGHFIGDLVVLGSAPEDSPNSGELFVNGMLLEGEVRVGDGNLGLLAIDHCTLLPGAGSLAILRGNDGLRVALRRSISGPLSIPVPIRGLSIEDCIVDGGSGSPDAAVLADTTETQIERSTLVGTAHVKTISASDCIFFGVVTAERRQVGCVRFSYVPPRSAVPRRYRCQPDTAIAVHLAAARDVAAAAGTKVALDEEKAIRSAVLGRLAPLFASRQYGDPEYVQLSRRCPVEIRTGAESGAEMGAFCFLEQPQREANLRDAVDEYLRLGLELGVFYVT
jgi:hypothetical protein